MKPFKVLMLVLATYCLTSCVSTEKMYYLQGAENLPTDINEQDYQLHIQPDDQLAISINSRDQELLAPFNS